MILMTVIVNNQFGRLTYHLEIGTAFLRGNLKEKIKTSRVHCTCALKTRTVIFANPFTLRDLNPT